MKFDNPEFVNKDTGVVVEFIACKVFVPNEVVTGYLELSEGNWAEQGAAKNIAQAFVEQVAWREEWEFVCQCASKEAVATIAFV